jgi:L-threonylcarbamoyladenylate synthase
MRVYLAVELILKAGMAAYNEGATRIADGELVAFPTETVYGLGADAGNGEAVAKIFAAKERPRFNPLIVHVLSKSAAAKLADLSPTAERLAEAFWPGDLTLVLPKKTGAKLADLVTAGLDTVAIRVPAHAVAREFLNVVDRPIAAPSANRSGRVSPTTAAHVAADLDGRVGLIIDGGPAPLGLESTIVAVDGERVSLLRPGGATVEDIERVLGYPMEKGAGSDERPTSPGQLRSHYAPRLPVRLNAGAVSASEALLAFGRPLDGAAATLNLSEDENLTEAAANLFAMLRQLDDKRFSAIAVMPVPANGLGLAINDRLHRAAAPRPEDGADD